MPDEQSANLRAQLLGELVAGQFAIEAAFAEYAGADPTVREQMRGQLVTISRLRQRIGTASIATLSTLQGQVVAIVALASSAAQEARASALVGSSGPMGMASYASAAREQVNATMAGMRDFDQYLHFGVGDTEAEYRQREAERRAYIGSQQNRHTPEGDLNASGAAVGQMADAAAHGAANSPAFEQRWNALIDSTARLRAQLVQDGRDVTEFDAHLREDLRRILKSKGLSDAQITAQFAAHHNDPMEAAQAFVVQQRGVISDQEISDLSRRASEYRAGAEATSVVAPSDTPASPMVDAIAKLRASGVEMAETNVGQPAHGVTAQIATVASLGRSR